MAEDGEHQSPLGVDAEQVTPSSPESEGELSEVNSPGSEGESDYEDAPSRLEESHQQENPADSSIQKSDPLSSDGHSRESSKKEACGEGTENVTSPHGAPSPRDALSPVIADETIYASASESFLSEAGEKDITQKEDDSPSEIVSEDNGDDTNDPLGLDEEDSNLDGVDDKEEGEESEEGELDGDDDVVVSRNAYQTEPVSSDDDLDAVQDNESQEASNAKAEKSSDSYQNNKIDSKRTGGEIKEGIPNGHTRTENYINHEDHVELDYEEDLDEGDKLRGDSKLEDDDKVSL